MNKKAKRRLAITAGVTGLVLLGLWLFLPRKVFWVELGCFAHEPGPMARPATVEARPVWGSRWRQVQFENRQISVHETDFLSRKYYHLWAVDTSACRFFMWTRRNRNLIHLGGPEVSLHLMRFSLRGEPYVGEHDFRSISNLVRCPQDADDQVVFELATAFAKRRIEKMAGHNPGMERTHSVDR